MNEYQQYESQRAGLLRALKRHGIANPAARFPKLGKANCYNGIMQSYWDDLYALQEALNAVVHEEEYQARVRAEA